MSVQPGVTIFHSGMCTVSDFLEALKNIRPETLVCLNDGPVNMILHEPGANEPFITIVHNRKIGRISE